MENPFLKLAREPLQWISDVAEVRDRRARGDRKLSREDLDKEASRILMDEEQNHRKNEDSDDR